MVKPASPLSVTDWDSREFFDLEPAFSYDAFSGRLTPLATNEPALIF